MRNPRGHPACLDARMDAAPSSPRECTAGLRLQVAQHAESTREPRVLRPSNGRRRPRYTTAAAVRQPPWYSWRAVTA